MLDILGLDLITNSEEAEAEKDVEESERGYRASDRAKIPDGIYYFLTKLLVNLDYLFRSSYMSV